MSKKDRVPVRRIDQKFGWGPVGYIKPDEACKVGLKWDDEGFKEITVYQHSTSDAKMTKVLTTRVRRNLLEVIDSQCGYTVKGLQESYRRELQPLAKIAVKRRRGQFRWGSDIGFISQDHQAKVAAGAETRITVYVDQAGKQKHAQVRASSLILIESSD